MKTAALLAIAACATPHQVITTGDALRPLRDASVASIEVRDNDVPRQETLQRDQQVTADGRVLTLGAIARDPAFGGFPIELRRYTDRDYGSALHLSAVSLVLGLTVGSVACGIACEDPGWKRASEITAISIGALGVAGLIYLLVSCVHGGCRD